jgi:hypothetical protein
MKSWSAPINLEWLFVIARIVFIAMFTNVTFLFILIKTTNNYYTAIKMLNNTYVSID